jgi:hypothetical protein
MGPAAQMTLRNTKSTSAQANVDRVSGGLSCGNQDVSISRKLWPDWLRARLRAAAIHLSISATIALALVLLVATVWYPAPMFELAKGRDIFLLMMGCDITLGPLMTLIIFNIRKARSELVRDLTIIATIQLAAMIYGVSALWEARPAYIVYAAGQFNVSLANELVESPDAPTGGWDGGPPWFGPKLVGARLPEGSLDRLRLAFSALEGRGDAFQMPQYFIPYADVKREVASRARSTAALAKELRFDAAQVQAAVAGFEHADASLGYLPLVIRQNLAIAVVHLPDGAFLGIAKLPPS